MANLSEKAAELKRKLPIVTPDQFDALQLFAEHYETLAPILTMTSEQITEALVRGYQTEG